MFSLVFSLPLVASDGTWWSALIFCDNPPFKMNKWAFILPVLSQLASRVGLLAMASWAFFPSGFLPRQLWGVAALTRLPSKCARHGEETCTSAYSLLFLLAMASWRRVTSTFCLTFAFLHVFFVSQVSTRAFSYKRVGIRCEKHNWVILQYLWAFRKITCKPSNQSA